MKIRLNQSSNWNWTSLNFYTSFWQGFIDFETVWFAIMMNLRSLKDRKYRAGVSKVLSRCASFSCGVNIREQETLLRHFNVWITSEECKKMLKFSRNQNQNRKESIIIRYSITINWSNFGQLRLGVMKRSEIWKIW